MAWRAGLAIGLLAAMAPVAARLWARMKPRSCNAIACMTAFYARVDPGPAGMPPGKHEVVVTADGERYSCSFVLPGRDPVQAEPGGCSSALTVRFVDDGACPDRGPNRICHLSEVVEIAGTPHEVHVQQFLDEAVVLDRVARPRYRGVYLSGPECGAYCYTTVVNWAFQ
jgi:hypothetical protein